MLLGKKASYKGTSCVVDSFIEEDKRRRSVEIFKKKTTCRIDSFVEGDKRFSIVSVFIVV